MTWKRCPDHGLFFCGDPLIWGHLHDACPECGVSLEPVERRERRRDPWPECPARTGMTLYDLRQGR